MFLLVIPVLFEVNKVCGIETGRAVPDLRSDKINKKSL